MVVPNLPLNVDLDQADAPFHEASRHQATFAVGRGPLVVEPVHGPRLVALLRDVESVAGRQLHARGQLVVHQAGREFRLAGPRLAVLAVHARQERAGQVEHRGRILLLGPQIQQGRALGAHAGALVHRRQPARLPVLDMVDRQALGIVQHHVGRQVLVLRAQAVRDPRTDGRPVRELAAALHDEDRRFVIEVRGEHRADEGDVVDLLRQVRQDLGNLHARLAVLGELVRRRHESASLVDELDIVGQIASRRLPFVLRESGFGVKQIHLAWPAVHEELDDGLRLGLEVRLALLEVVDAALADRPRRRARVQQVPPQQRCQRRAVQPVPDAGEEIAARRTDRRSCHVVSICVVARHGRPPGLSQCTGTPRN